MSTSGHDRLLRRGRLVLRIALALRLHSHGRSGALPLRRSGALALRLHGSRRGMTARHAARYAMHEVGRHRGSARKDSDATAGAKMIPNPRRHRLPADC